ncbi:MAG: hypothetical protein LBK71_12275 [Verrucomicrobiales bacterium]|jgi:hypothetical protein|nr:hypothetical protein [Verrucomicrobiales bacterium]
MKKYIIMTGLLMAAITTNAQIIQTAKDITYTPNSATWVDLGISITTVNTGALSMSVSAIYESNATATNSDSLGKTFMANTWGIFNTSGGQVGVGMLSNYGVWQPATPSWKTITSSLTVITGQVPAGTYSIKIQRGEDTANSRAYSDQYASISVNYQLTIFATGNDPTATINALAARVGIVENEVAAINTVLNGTAAELAETRDLLTQYYAELNMLRSLLSGVTTRVDGHDDALASHDDTLAGLGTQIVTIEKNITDVQTDVLLRITALSVRMDGLDGRVNSLEQRVTTLAGKKQNDNLAWSGVGLGSAGLLSLFGYGLADDEAPGRTATKESPKSGRGPNTTYPTNTRPVTSNTVNTSIPINAYSRPANLTYPSNRK